MTKRIIAKKNSWNLNFAIKYMVEMIEFVEVKYHKILINVNETKRNKIKINFNNFII